MLNEFQLFMGFYLVQGKTYWIVQTIPVVTFYNKGGKCYWRINSLQTIKYLDIQIGLTIILNNLRKTQKIPYLGKIPPLVLSVTDLIT